MAYLRIAIRPLKDEVGTPEQKAMEERVQTEGVTFLRQQPGFVRLQTAHADSQTLITVMEWASEAQGTVGMERWQEWVLSHGGRGPEGVQSYGGNVVVSS